MTGNSNRRTGWLVGSALALALLGAAWGAGWIPGLRRSGGGKGQAGEGAPLAPRPMLVGPRIYMLGRLNPSVAYVIQTSDGLVLVDTGVDPDAGELIQQLGELDLKLADLKAILLTNVHTDHIFGARKLRELTQATIHAGAGDAAVLRAGAPREAFFATLDLRDVVLHETEVDVELAGGETLEFGDTRITALATPGHTPGSICYMLERDGQRILFTGDTVASLVGKLGTHMAYLPPRYRGNARDYLGSLRKLRELPPPNIVLTGHPIDSRYRYPPRPSPDQWNDVLDRGIRDLQRLVQRFDADGENFLDGEPKDLLAGLRYLGDCGGRAVYAVLGESSQYLFDAPGGSELPDFVAAGLRRAGVERPQVEAVLLTSIDSSATTGLRALVERFECAVVTAAPAHETVRRMCPVQTRFQQPDEITKMGPFRVDFTPLAGRSVAPIAWWLRDDEHTVLVSGQFPVPISPDMLANLQDEMQSRLADPPLYLKSLDLLGQRRPNLWLMAHPPFGQNANVYDEQWRAVLDANARAAGGTRLR